MYSQQNLLLGMDELKSQEMKEQSMQCNVQSCMLNS